MTVTIQTAVTGDVGDTRLLRLDGVTDLVSATAIEAHVWNDATDSVTLATAITDATERTVTVALGAAGGWLPTAPVGIYNLEVQVTFGTTVLTWPAREPATIQVRPAR